MEKKTLLAVVLILGIFWVSNEFIWKPKAEAKYAQEQIKQEEVVQKEVSLPKPNEEQKVETIINNDIPIQNDLELITSLDDDNVTYIFSNKGALLTSVVLDEYYINDKETNVNLIFPEGSIYNIVFNQRSGEQIDLANIVFKPEILEDNKKIIFTYSDGTSYIKKIYQISDQLYTLDMNIIVNGFESLENYQIQMEDGIPDTEEFLKMKSRDYQVTYQLNNQIEKFSLSGLKLETEVDKNGKFSNKFNLSGKIDWVAVRSKYFMQGLIPNQLISMEKLKAFRNNGSPAVNLQVEIEKDYFEHEYQLYFGPLITEHLEAFSNGIDNCVETGPGFLRWLSRAFLWLYIFINRFVPNWGLSVIIFAIILKTALYPLTHKSFESSTKMQKINPMMKEIQAKYKSDPKKMNNELRALYKEQGVNPMGGCLPMLLQMPILFAIYPIFRYSINLRQSHFLWLPDLSEPDPFFILPIIMAIFMFIQQKMMAPANQNIEEMDEKQKAAVQSQKMMMYMMPLMMLFFFKSLASGLVLYWTVFSIIGTVQQIAIKKKFK